MPSQWNVYLIVLLSLVLTMTSSHARHMCIVEFMDTEDCIKYMKAHSPFRRIRAQIPPGFSLNKKHDWSNFMNRIEVDDSMETKLYQNGASLYNQNELIDSSAGYYDKSSGYYGNGDIGYNDGVEVHSNEARDAYYRRMRLENDEVNSHIENAMNQQYYS
ncbi:uncharacterized protein [Clytia hemisphaerica]|uniref:Uncharacterized protein n=1 Tax=Clytia hemisphaerica TaxID=252671 RepID=A0A7M5VC01_9CNID|eukprot:TCONS_00016922-protein